MKGQKGEKHTLTRERFEYLLDGMERSEFVTIRPADRQKVHPDLKDRWGDITIGELNARLLLAALQRAGAVPADVEFEHFRDNMLDGGPVVLEGDGPGEAGATSTML